MPRQDTRRVFKELRRRCHANGVDVSVEGGKGSHWGLVFHDRKSDQKARIVISGDREISPGVQRNVLKYLGAIADRVALARVVRRILETIFKN